MPQFESLDFSQPKNKLSEVAEQIRKQQLSRNDYTLDNQFGSTNPDAISDGDQYGKGTGTFLDTSNGGSSVDKTERLSELKFNQYSSNKPYQNPA